MTSPWFRVLQMLTRYLLAVSWVALTIAATGLLFFGNFLVSWQAFELLGYEVKPLSEVPLLGSFALAAGVGNAPLVSLYAAGLTSAMALIVVSTAKFGNDALTLFFDYRQARLAGTPSSATLIKLWENGVAFVALGVLAVLVTGYDVWLFGLKLETLVTGIDDIQDTISWLPEPVSRLGGYMAQFVRHAQWGYLAVVFGVAYATEKAFPRATERWLVLGQTLDAALLAPNATQPAVGGASFGDVVEGAPITSVAAPAGTPATEPMPAGGPDVVGPPENVHINPAPVHPAPAPPVRGPVDPGTTPPPHRGPLVRVICGPGITREMPLQELERNAEYVRDGSGREWFLKTYYDSLTAEPRRGEAQDETPQNEEEHSHV